MSADFSKRIELFTVLALKEIDRFKVILLLNPKLIDSRNPLDRSNETAMHVAVRLRCIDALLFLIQRESTAMWIKDAQGFTPLHIAAMRGYLDCFNILVERSSAELSAKCREGQTPLIKAVLCNRMDIFDRIINIRDTDININTTDIRGNTALSYAIRHKRKYMYNIMISFKDISINHINNEGQSMLHIAAKAGDFDVVCFLLENANRDLAFVELRDNTNSTALDYAHKGTHEEHPICERKLVEQYGEFFRSIFS